MEGTKTPSFLLSKGSPNAVFTPEDLTEEHKLIAQTAKQFIEKEVTPQREAIEKQDFHLVVSLLRRAGELGLLAHSIPEEYGGLGLDKITKGLVGEIVGGASSYGVAHSNHTCIATLPITYFGTKEQKEKYLPKLASGEYLGAYCLTEPGSGSDALAARTTAFLNTEQTHYVLNGTKIYITNAVFSDTFIVYAKVDGDKLTGFIVEKGFPGLSLGPEEKKMGIIGSSTRSVILNDCEVPIENLLGEIGKGHVIALNVLNLGRFNLGAACMGASKGSLRLALHHTRERKQFGQSIASFAATKEKVAKMTTRIFACESIQYRTAGLLEEDLGELNGTNDPKLIGNRMMEHALECAICKIYGSETLDQVVDESLQLHGGAGFIKEYPIEQAYRDSRINRIFEGTNEINRLVIPTFLFRKANNGEIQLNEEVQKALEVLRQSPRSFEGVLGREMAITEAIRNIFLVCAGLMYETFGNRLKEEQEALMNLAEIAIHLYAAETVVLRVQKAIEKNGNEKEKLKEEIAISFLDDTVLKVEMIARQLIGGLPSEVNGRQYTCLVTSSLRDFQPSNSVERNRFIADKVNEAGNYSHK